MNDREVIKTNYEQALNEYDQARKEADETIRQLRVRVKSHELSQADYKELLPGISRRVEPYKTRYEQALKAYRAAGLDLENALGLE